ncbi:retrotransposon protein, putative, ty1-copia subclass [Tanacetum coccineum]
MTTLVGNNSVFKSFFEKQKLNRPNFIDYRQLRLVLSTEDKEKYLEQPIFAAPVAAAPRQAIPAAALATHNEWVKEQNEVVVLMLLTMDLDIQRNLAHLSAYDMLQELKAISYVLKMKSYIDNLERLSHPVDQKLVVSLILVSLSKEYDGFVQNYNMHGVRKTVNELHAMLKLHEETLPKKDAPPALHVIRAGRVQKNHNKKPHKAAKGVQRKGKGKMGYAHVHTASYAPKLKNPPPPKKDNPAKDAICHQCGEVGHWRRNCPVYLVELLKKKKLSQGASTSCIFTIELYSFPSTSWFMTRVVVLTSVILLKVSGECYPKGWKVRFMYVWKDGKKTLFTSSGKGKGSTWTHTDVCGPFRIVSRQGASYFVTFTDDFSRYGYVYLLKHKHEVFETFKVFQKEVENQLGKTIKSLCSDRGGEYMSQEFLDHLKEHRIIAHHTPPYTPQHNGVSERRNRTLLDMVRSMMSQTTLPKSFWDYALEFVARILNMVPTKKVDKTPYEVWHGQASKLSYLKVCSYEALVKRDTLTKPDKLELELTNNTHESTFGSIGLFF